MHHLHRQQRTRRGKEGIAAAISKNNLVASAILSGNRNFEGRINPVVRFNYLASPPLVVAYAIAGTMDFDVETQPLGTDQSGKPVFLKDIWPTSEEIAATVASSIDSEMFRKSYGKVFDGDERWQGLAVPKGNLFQWDVKSEYVKAPPFGDEMAKAPQPLKDIVGARVLAVLGDSVTTDHISPAGNIARNGPAGEYLVAHGVGPEGFQFVWRASRQS